MFDEQAAAELREAINARVAERVEQARRRREQQRADRATKDRRRVAGLRARHATKLTRVAQRRNAS